MSRRTPAAAPPAEEEGTAARVVVLGTGGTIASLPTHTSGVVASLHAGRLLGDAAGECPVEVRELLSVNSYAMTIEQVLAVALAARAAAARPDIDGVVITHGTDTMAETAYLADLMHGGPEPIVFTGAQRHAGRADGDGPANLREAIRLAADTRARGLGAVICMAGEVHAAREATKRHTTALDAFTSPGTSPVARCRDGGLEILRRPVRPATFAAAEDLEPAVALIRLTVGVDGMLIDACRRTGTKGLVVEAFGLGNANAAVVAAVQRARSAGMTVMVSSRVPAGAVRPLYGAGGGTDLLAAGALFAGTLSGSKARLLLMLALRRTADREELAVRLAPHLHVPGA